MKTIEVRTIPHANQFYETIGDYQEIDGGRLVSVSVSAMSDWRSEAAVAIHELIEYFLVKRARIKLADIDLWDLEHQDSAEPGDVPDCPYGAQHRFAENIERLVVAQLGLTWSEHEGNVDGAATAGTGSKRPGRALRGAGRGSNGMGAGGDRQLHHGPGAAAPLGARADTEDD